MSLAALPERAYKFEPALQDAAESFEKHVNPHDHQYHTLLRKVLAEGIQSEDRTGTGTIRILGHQMRFDLGQGFPLLTTKRLHIKSIVHELLWFLSGSSNVRYLQENGVRIWNEWADESGELGPVYGVQWRSWRDYEGGAIDQIKQVIQSIKTRPEGRRHIVSAWNVAQIKDMALPPCHMLFQFHVLDGRLSCQMYQRSADCFLGVPYNIASYALLTHMVAKVCKLEVGELIHILGDTHLYLNHLDQAREQIARKPHVPPQLELTGDITDIDKFTFDDIRVANYNTHPHIKAQVSV